MLVHVILIDQFLDFARSWNESTNVAYQMFTLFHVPSHVFARSSCLALLGAGWLHAVDIHVNPAGSDSQPGSREKPVKTLAAARDLARQWAGRESVTVRVADGVYYLPETLVFRAGDSGSEKHPVVYEAENEGKAILSGGMRLSLKWSAYRDGIFQANTPAGLVIDQLFTDGVRQRMARYPNYDAAQVTAAYQGYAADAFSRERAAKWSDPTGGYIHAMHVHRWGGYHYRITGKNADGTVAYEGGWQNNRQNGMHPEFRMVENIFEELDAPGEWFHQAKTNTLYFKPEPGVDLSKVEVEVVRLAHLIEFQGSESAPVRFITLRGFLYRHAARTFMNNKEPLLRSDWTIDRGGAVTLTGTEDVRVLDSEFDQLGGNAIFFNGYNRRSGIKGCHIHDSGASGVCFVGDPNAVRAPLFEYGQTQDLTKMDRTPGPKSNHYPAECFVEDSLIHGIGRVERQPAGVQIAMAQGIVVRDCSIYDCARAGINIGDGCWGGHLIERCDVFDTVLETHDHGSFNSWGRDRYWAPNHRGVSQPEVKKDPQLPFLDVVKPIVIRNSRWRCDHGWDVDLDDGSSRYEIYNNVMLNGGLKFREGYGRTAYNNIFVNSGFHPHVWFEDSGDTFHHNIVMVTHADIGMPKGWGKGVDRNLFGNNSALNAARQKGCDPNSIAGDPMFVDPSHGDFRVREDSPALKLGFKNFPMDQFGVKKTGLKARASVPRFEVPVRQESNKQEPESLAQYWLGASLHGLEGEEFSAFGVGREDGGVQLVAVPAGSAAAAAGLQSNDLIQEVNGMKTPKVAHFFAAILKAENAPLQLVVVRNQKPERRRVLPSSHLIAESVKSPADLRKVVLESATTGKLTASLKVNNEPLASLIDGKLAANYGPIFGNGARGAYKLDLGEVKPIRMVSSWSYNQNGNRARQRVTIFASDSKSDPGWDTNDRQRFVALGTLDTASLPAGDFHAAALRAQPGQNLATARWIVWQVGPITEVEENTAFQELSVEASRP